MLHEPRRIAELHHRSLTRRSPNAGDSISPRRTLL